MQVLLWIAAAAIMFALGRRLMKAIDGFLGSLNQAPALPCSWEENRLRIGLSNPLVADSLAVILERYAKKQPTISVNFLSGSEDTLMQELSSHDLDMVFLPVNASNPKKVHYPAGEIFLDQTPVIMEYGDLPIKPLEAKHIPQKFLWTETNISPVVRGFIRYLKEEATVHVDTKIDIE